MDGMRDANGLMLDVDSCSSAVGARDRTRAAVGATDERRRSTSLGRDRLIESVVAGSPALAVVIIDGGSPGVIAAVLGALLLAGLVSCSGRQIPAKVILCGALAVGVAFAAGRTAALSFVLAIWQVAVLRRVGPATGEGTLDLMGPLVGVAVLVALLGDGSAAVPMVIFVQAVLLAALHAGRWAVEGLAATSRALRLLLQGVAAVFNVLGMTVLFSLAVMVPWAPHRLLGVNPLTPTPETGWLERGRVKPRGRSMWVPRVIVARSGPWIALRRSAAAIMSLAILVALGLASVAWMTQSRPKDASLEMPAAVADLEWYPEYEAVSRWLGIPGEENVYDPFGPHRIGDVNSKFINVADGVRRSWAPPPCGACRRIRVWMYGGSTTFGIGQRDEHTIASELARLAYDNGVVVDVVNRGQPADMHWEEAQRFAWDVGGAQPPDLVLFYDGTNEIWAGSVLDDRGWGGDESPWNPEVENAKSNYRALIPTMEGFFDPARPAGVEVPDQRQVTDDRLAPAVLAGHTMARYGRSRETSAAAAEYHGVSAAWFWQPCLHAAGRVEGEPTQLEFMEEGCAETRSKLPADVIDLTDSLDGRDEPVFIDAFHTNEEGAHMAAAVLFDHLEAELRSLAAEPGS